MKHNYTVVTDRVDSVVIGVTRRGHDVVKHYYDYKVINPLGEVVLDSDGESWDDMEYAEAEGKRALADHLRDNPPMWWECLSDELLPTWFHPVTGERCEWNAYSNIPRPHQTVFMWRDYVRGRVSDQRWASKRRRRFALDVTGVDRVDTRYTPTGKAVS